MTKGDNGVWTVTIGPLAPDIYTYAFNVDGVTALDPRNANTKYGYGTFGAVSVVEVPGDGPQFYDVEAGAARRGAHPALRVEVARRRADGVGLHAAGTTTRAATSRCCTCCTAPATSSPAGR